MLENEVLLSKKDASDYYSLWVHQIKTPISAMHLLIQSFEEQAMEFEEHAEETLDFLNEMKMKIFQTEEYYAAGSSQIFPDLHFEKDSFEFSGQQADGAHR